MSDIFSIIQKLSSSDQSSALCLVVSTKGSTPRKAGAKMIVTEQGEIFGSIGGGNLEKVVIKNALEVIYHKKPQLYKHELLNEHGMCCGGVVEIYIEPIIKMNKLYIFGAGHIGKNLARFAAELQFTVTLIDERAEMFDDFKLNGVTIFNKNHHNAIKNLKFDENTFIAIVTHSHLYDREILSYCIRQPFAYLGMIGSLRKVKLTEKIFVREKKANLEELKKVDMPMGLSINAQTPEEIAISILGKIISVKNKV